MAGPGECRTAGCGPGAAQARILQAQVSRSPEVWVPAPQGEGSPVGAEAPASKAVSGEGRHRKSEGGKGRTFLHPRVNFPAVRPLRAAWTWCQRRRQEAHSPAELQGPLVGILTSESRCAGLAFSKPYSISKRPQQRTAQQM